MAHDSTLFDGQRMTFSETIDLVVESMRAHGPNYRRWAASWSMGKDSTFLVTLLVALLKSGKIQPPEELTVLQVDTRMELPPLAIAGAHIRAELEGVAEELSDIGCKLTVRTIHPPMDDRFFVYILGRGVPPPSNTFRWCTERMKVNPMAAELERLSGERRDKILMLTGLRIGESAARDDRIALSCGRDGGECGQGWFQQTLQSSLVDTLSPILHARVCHVWAYLRHHAPAQGFDTALLAEAYGGEEAEEINARTGCVGCPVASEDHALARICRMPAWAYLAPLQGLRSYYWGTLRSPLVRLRKKAGERRKDGALVKNQQRMGPITLEGRRAGLAFVLGVQAEVNEAARRLGRPDIDILNPEEIARIQELIEAKTWPEKWTGDEPIATVMSDVAHADGSVQPLLRGLFR